MESEGELELVVVEVGVQGEGAVVPDADAQVGAAEDEEAGVACQLRGDVTAGEGVQTELGVLGLELVGGGGEGGVERGEDGELGRDGEVVRRRAQKRIAVEDVASGHHDTSGMAACTCSVVT